MDKLSVKGLALGMGIPWGLCMLAGGLMAPAWASGFVQVFSTVYPGYGPGLVLGIIGGVEAFFDGAVAGALIALIYNWSTSKKKSRR